MNSLDIYCLYTFNSPGETLQMGEGHRAVPSGLGLDTLPLVADRLQSGRQHGGCLRQPTGVDQKRTDAEAVVDGLGGRRTTCVALLLLLLQLCVVGVGRWLQSARNALAVGVGDAIGKLAAAVDERLAVLWTFICS